MNEIQTIERQLPDTLPELAKFALVGREKLAAVRAEIRAIDKLNLANEVHEQKLIEAQDIAEAVLDAEVKIGELTAQIEKAKNQYTIQKAIDSGVDSKTKAETLKEIGIPQKTAERFERLAKHPELIQEAKDSAREHGEIVTRQDVINRIAAQEIPTRQQKEAKELREAKKRHEDFAEQKSDGVINIADVRQDQEDSKLIFNDFNETLIAFNRNYHAINRLIVDDELKDRLRGADHYELRELYDRCRNWHSMTIQLLRQIEEVINEK